MKKAKLVFIPSPGTGHLIAGVEFAKGLLDLNEKFSITILIIRTPGATAEMENYNNSFSIIDTHIQYITLPQAVPPDSIDPRTQTIEYFMSSFMESHKPHVKNAIINQVMSNDSVPLAGVIVDMFCSSMIDVAKEIQVPSYVFCPSGTAALGLMMFLQKHHDQVGSEFKENDPDHSFPSYVNPVPSCVVPTFLFNKYGYNSFLCHSKKYKEANGIIVNSFLELESHAFNSFQALNDVPPVYTVGPIINLQGQSHIDGSNKIKQDKIMEWLNEQPEQSVIFLCFGSMGSFTEPQLKQIAIALEQSGHRFLWSVRKSPPKDQISLPTEYDSYEELLPEGFLERIRRTGLICGWVPQIKVLGHKAIGAFVSHCGWNSILESVWHGVPIVTWPMYAEQQINAFQIVKDLGLAVELRLDYKINGIEPCPLVMADEIVKSLDYVMRHDCEVRNKVKAMSKTSRQALMEGGSSVVQFHCLVDAILGNCA